jgi:hypothetical protein
MDSNLLFRVGMVVVIWTFWDANTEFILWSSELCDRRLFVIFNLFRSLTLPLSGPSSTSFFPHPSYWVYTFSSQPPLCYYFKYFLIYLIYTRKYCDGENKSIFRFWRVYNFRVPSVCLSVSLAIAWTVGRILFIFGLCGLVVRVPGYRFRGPGSISGATRFFLRSSGSGTGSTQPREDNWGAISRK